MFNPFTGVWSLAHVYAHIQNTKKKDICRRGKQQDSTLWHLYLNLGFHSDASHALTKLLEQLGKGSLCRRGASVTGTELILAAAAG